MKGIALRGLGRSSLLLSNLIYTSTVYDTLPPAALCFLREAFYNKFIEHGKVISIKTGVARKSLSNEYVPASIDCTYNAYVGRYLDQLQESAGFRSTDLDTIVFSSSNSISYSRDIESILNSNLESDLKKEERTMIRALPDFKNIVLINPDLFVLNMVNNYYKTIYSKLMKNIKIEPVKVIAITERSPSRNLQRVDQYTVKYHDSVNDIILYDIVNLNPYQDTNKENELINFFKKLNNDARKLAYLRTTDISTFTFKNIMSTFSEGYINGLSTLFECDPLVLKDVVTDEGYLDLYQKYIPEFQWYVKTHFPDLVDKFGGDIETSPFSKKSLNQFITDVTQKKRTPYELFTDNNYTNRLAASKMDPDKKVRFIKEAVIYDKENSIVSKIGLNQFFRKGKIEDDRAKLFMPNTHLLFQMCMMKLQINTYEKSKTRLNFKDDVEFIKSLLAKK